MGMNEGQMRDVEPHGVVLKPIPGIIGYAAGNDGYIYSFRRQGWNGRSDRLPKYTTTPTRLIGGTTERGYKVVGIHWRESKTMSVHRLVASSFHGPCPDGLECSHINGNPSDNRPENLAWETSLDNHDRRFRHGTVRRGKDSGMSKLSEGDVLAIRSDGRKVTLVVLAKKYGVHFSTIAKIKRGETWRHLL